MNPTAEICNGIDDDCDGTIDEGVTLTFYVDRDGDGFGASAGGIETTQACTKPTGFSANNSDCNDTPGTGFFTNPAASEICDPTLVDENCNGMANEGCGCASVGATQPCCAGRGTQVCEALDGGLTLSGCSVSPSREVCNGIDDDCDGLTDELVALTTADGGALAPLDGGTFELDGGCTSGLGACAAPGVASCASARFVCSATPGTPGVETCNGVDDDCDGEVDEAPATLCAVTGQSCAAGACACPTGQSVCGSSCQAVGSTCSLGVGACARAGVMTCSSGSLVCNATPGQPTTEVCNNLDDNCDGTIDEGGSALCTVTGQSCTAGSCACPAAQSVCGTSCQTLGASCSNGTGACQRAGNIVCSSGSATCNAVAGAPASEVCDGLDNNCDGVVDEFLKLFCYPDGDGDSWATNTTITQFCPDASRPQFANCPPSFVGPAASYGIDCDPANPNLFQTASTRVDADGDTRCVGSAAISCLGATAPAGRRFTSSCAAVDDCNDANASLFQSLTVRADADADTYCTGPSVVQCAGAVPSAGYRVASSCASTDDCNDSNANAFKLYPVRADADADGYCVGAVTNQCAGNAPLAGTRLASSCQAIDDCTDANPNATGTCFIAGGYQTTSATKQCGIGFMPTEGKVVGVVQACPVGFTLTNNSAVYSGASGGICTVVSPTSTTMSCSSLVFGSFSCSITGDCAAN